MLTLVTSLLLYEIARVPMWAWLVVVNLAAALALAIALFVETKPTTFVRRAIVVAVLVLLAGIIGIGVALVYAVLYAWEAELWRTHVAAEPPRGEG